LSAYPDIANKWLLSDTSSKSGVYVLPCRFDTECKRDGNYSTEQGSHCLHQGGSDCKIWRRKTNLAISRRFAERF